MACHDRGGGLAEGAGLHVMGEVGDHRAVHLEVDLDRRAAEFGMGRGAGIGVGKPAQTWNVPGRLDDALVVNVVQHIMEVPPARPWRPGVRSYIWKHPDEIQSGSFLRRPAAACPPRLPVTLRSC